MNEDPSLKGEHSDFAEMLWERGTRIEREIIDSIKRDREVMAITGPAGPATFAATFKLMKEGADWIYQGVLLDGDKIGRPDLLQKALGRSKLGDHFYIPCDIKSGRATVDKDSDDIKSHYANQMLFYCDLLESVQGSRPDVARIIDAAGEVTEFEVSEYDGPYQESKQQIEGIVYGSEQPEPVIGGICKECVWSKVCLDWANSCSDMTLLYKLGKQKFALKDRGVRTIADVAGMAVARFAAGPDKIPRAGAKTLEAWKRRANVWQAGKPVIHTPPQFRNAPLVVYYDIEDDPSIDHVYLHGLIELAAGQRRPYHYFLAPVRADEERAAREMWNYLSELPEGAVIYHYGSYEKTKLAGLARKYGLPTEILDKFDRLRVDLYRTVEQSSDWPVSSYGIKPIAKHLGFKWTAEDASGANSIAWYAEYQADPSNKKDVLGKILTYNREDCEAMIVVKDFLAREH